MSESEKIDLLNTALTEIEPTVVEEDIQDGNASISKKMKLIQKHSQHTVSTEVPRYIGASVSQSGEEFWQQHCETYPCLAQLARKYLTQNASSVPVESMFSTAGLVLNSKRSVLTPYKANSIMFIHDNYPLFFPLH